MRLRTQLRLLLFLVVVATGLSIAALAKHAQSDKDQNVAVIIGEAGEQYPIYGAGGIRVRGGHHGFFASNVKSSQIEIDGSGISPQKLIALNENTDFAASANNAYFVSTSAVCTLGTAVGAAGQEIIVCNAGQGVTITYQTTNGETLFGGERLGVLVANSTAGKVDKFISDGKCWYRE
jgi:hypothetical protein